MLSTWCQQCKCFKQLKSCFHALSLKAPPNKLQRASSRIALLQDLPCETYLARRPCELAKPPARPSATSARPCKGCPQKPGCRAGASTIEVPRVKVGRCASALRTFPTRRAMFLEHVILQLLQLFACCHFSCVGQAARRCDCSHDDLNACVLL